MHGHNWKVEVEVCGNKLDNIGMIVDFKEIKSSAKKIGERLSPLPVRHLILISNDR